MIGVICIYHLLYHDIDIFVLLFHILREVVKFAVHIWNIPSPLEATGRPGYLGQFLAWH